MASQDTKRIALCPVFTGTTKCIVLAVSTSIKEHPVSQENASEGQKVSPGNGMIMALVGLLLSYNLSLNVTPILNGVWASDPGLSPREAGLVISGQIVAMALTMLFLARRLRKLEPSRLAKISILLVGIGHVASALATSLILIFCFFALTGLGIGIQLACLSGLLSQSIRADRTYAIAIMLTSIAVAFLTIGYAWLAAAVDRHTLFLALLLVPLVQLGLCKFIPRTEPLLDSDVAEPYAVGGIPPVLFALCFMQMGGMAVWAFTERQGHHLGITTELIGTILAATAISGICGASIAALVAKGHLRRIMAVLGLVGFGAANVGIVIATGWIGYAGALQLQAFTLTFTLPFLTAIALEVPDRGQTAIKANGWSMLAGATSPYIAGWLIELQGFGAIAIYCGVAMIISIVAIMPRTYRNRAN